MPVQAGDPGVDRAEVDHPAVNGRVGAGRRHGSRTSSLVLAGVLLVALLPLVPKWPYPSFTASTPTFFTSSDVDRVPAGGIVLTYPYSDNPDADGMLWQAESSMRFRIVGGYALVAGPGHLASYNPFPAIGASVPATLVADYRGTTPPSVLPGATRATPADVRAYLARYGIGTVLAQPVGVHPGAAYSLLTAALGTRPQRIGGVDGWFDVPADLARVRVLGPLSTAGSPAGPACPTPPPVRYVRAARRGRARAGCGAAKGRATPAVTGGPHWTCS